MRDLAIRVGAIAAIGVAVVVAVVAATVWRETWATDSGEGWILENRSVSADEPPGSVSAEIAGEALRVSFVVASSTGGDSECRLPWISSSERSDSGLTIQMRWQKRGCRDVGAIEYTLMVRDVPPGGLDLAFPITPENPCEHAHFNDDGTTRSCSACIRAPWGESAACGEADALAD